MNGVRAALRGPKFAVVRIFQREFKVTEGDRIQVGETVWADIGEKIRFKKVRMVGGERFTAIGRPLLENCSIEATVEEHFRSKYQYIYRKVNGSDAFAKWNDAAMPSTILRVDKIVFEPQMKIENSAETYQLKETTEEEAEKLDSKEEAISPSKWSTEANGPKWDSASNPELDPNVVDFGRWRKMEQIQDLRLYSPGMKYWWWPKSKFESGTLDDPR
eukprot:TRINITY_DN17068_c0_g1_i1.p1 TRINITY_DN17068_c0_g1~~TRINITY_DN17068_c0_g1_i1.p1  ORF type:complete len:217 (+),score=44.63 TRINITY_DN17068_c0_g1_i1:42-692(+)